MTSGNFGLRQKNRLTASLVFDTAWRIGSGKEGETMSDLGVVLDPRGQPLLPGSSLKGKLRSTCEALAHALGLSTCMLNYDASGVKCTSDVTYYRKVREAYQKASRRMQDRLQWLDENTCNVCKLFGSPVRAGRLLMSDGTLKSWASVVQVRDGVVIDRDSQTAVDGLKYDYEVVPPDSRFQIYIDLENPTDQDMALLGVALFEWHTGSSIGGFTSRGLGRFHLEDLRLAGVDMSDPKQRVKFLTATKAKERLSDLGDWEDYFTKKINRQLNLAAETEED
jgi:CRISPR-associated RAMP protein (TIGR02581 family)